MLEIKRDVFNELASELNEHMATVDCGGYYYRYEHALPDNVPTIPLAASTWIKKCKKEKVNLGDALCSEMRPEDVREWMAFKEGNIANGFDSAGYRKKQEIIANAWILEKWIVKETGKVDGI